MSLAERFERHLRGLALPPGPALVAVSGGPDSLALLDLLARTPTARSFALHVAHADHGMQAGSAEVAERVSRTAEQYRLPFHLAKLKLGGQASETRARSARYRWLESLAEELAAELIFTGHQQDDQVETILMRVLKGSGPAGLAGIPTRRGKLVRPLLPFRREELAEYLHERKLEAWEDPANRELRHQRSWIRCELLPELRRRVPRIERNLLALGRQAALSRAAWDEVLGRLPDLDLKSACDGLSVAASPLHGYDSGSLRALLGALGRRAGCLIGPQRAEQIERLLQSGRSGAVAELGGGFAAELSFGRLRFFRGSAHPALWIAQTIEAPAGELVIGERGWRISWRREPAPEKLERGSRSSWFTEGGYVVRPWKAGDRIRPLGAGGRRLVVRCLQDARIPRSQREAWPVLEAGGIVVWVPGVCRAAERIPAPGTLAVRIDAELR